MSHEPSKKNFLILATFYPPNSFAHLYVTVPHLYVTVPHLYVTVPHLYVTVQKFLKCM